MNENNRELGKDEIFAMRQRVRDGGRDAYLKTYKELIDAQDEYLARVKELGLDPGYIGQLFARCHDAFAKNDAAAMGDAARECLALSKIEDGTIGTERPELEDPGTRIVQWAWVLQ